MSQRYTEKVVVITGVNDRGIGGAIAERLAQEGAKLALLWKERPERLLRRFTKRGVHCLDLETDVTEQNSVTTSIQNIVDQFGKIDVLINNAGVEHSGHLESTSDQQWQHVLDVNLTGAMRMIRESLPHLSEPGGTIVNLASVLGIAGCGGFPAYSATKAGVVGLTQSIAMELAPRGMRAVCVAPALVHTPMIHKYISQMTESAAEQIRASHPMGVGTPQDVAAAVAFIASSEAQWITGVTLPLGWSAAFPLPMQQFLSDGGDSASSIRIEDWLNKQDVESPQRKAAG